MKIIKFELLGIIVSFLLLTLKHHKRLAINQTNPTTLGPLRRCINAINFRSIIVKKATEIKTQTINTKIFNKVTKIKNNINIFCIKNKYPLSDSNRYPKERNRF